MIVFVTFIAVCYVLLIVSLAIGFGRVKAFSNESIIPKTKFSIIIPFRNEAENLPFLLESIVNLDYPNDLFEVFFVDDASDDNSKEIIEDFFRPDRSVILKNERTSNSPKKDAIATAINQAKYNWIITTDADCILPEKWLQTLDNFIQQKHPNMVVGAVNYRVNNSFLERFQLLDFLSMQGTTVGGFGIKYPFMCNGANLAYKKDIFIQLNGFKGNNNIASGDDVFLFEKFLKHDKKSVLFLKSDKAIVTTFPARSWQNLVQQRVRWASKASNFSLQLTKAIGFIVLTMNLNLIVTLLLGVFQQISFWYFVSLFAIKYIVDLLLFLPTVRFYKQIKNFLKTYFLSSILYPFFSVFVVFYSIFFKFSWKGRRFKK